jgi:5,10-methylenetetrahydromethanopterin reductase
VIGRGEAAELEGRTVTVAAAAPAPILLAASQPRMLSLAGEVADGVILMGAADPELTAWQLERVAEGAAAAGRTIDELTVDLWFTISLSDDRGRAIDDVRPWALSQARWFHRWRDPPDPLLPFQAEFDRATAAHSFGGHLARGSDERRSVSDEFVEWVGVAGNLDACVAKIRPLLDLGIDRITVALLPGGRAERIERYGRELIPALTG